MKEYIIDRNKRKDKNNFFMEYECAFCNRFSSQVIAFKQAKIKKLYSSPDIRICKTCLCEMIGALDENMQINFERDFLEERGFSHESLTPSEFEKAKIISIKLKNLTEKFSEEFTTGLLKLAKTVAEHRLKGQKK